MCLPVDLSGWQESRTWEAGSISGSLRRLRERIFFGTRAPRVGAKRPQLGGAELARLRYSYFNLWALIVVKTVVSRKWEVSLCWLYYPTGRACRNFLNLAMDNSLKFTELERGRRRRNTLMATLSVQSGSRPSGAPASSHAGQTACFSRACACRGAAPAAPAATLSFSPG